MNASESRVTFGISLKCLIAACVGVVTAGCAHHGARIDDAWLARVPKEDLQGVYEARAAHRQALDDVTRADVKHRDAERLLNVARHERDSAEANAKASQGVVEAARATGRPDEIQKAQFLRRDADMSVSAANAKVAWREKEVGAKEAEKEWMERLAEASQQELALAEYRALKQAGDVRAARYSEADFEERLAKAQLGAAKGRRELESRLRDCRDAHAQWVRWQQVEGYGGSGLQTIDDIKIDEP